MRKVPVVTAFAAAVALLAMVAVSFSDHAEEPAQAGAPVIVGIDMDPHAAPANSCPGTGAADCTIGSMEKCVSVSAAQYTTFDIDAFVQSLDNGHSGWSWRLAFPDTTSGAKLTLTAQTELAAAVNLIMQSPGSAPVSQSDGVPDAVSPHIGAAADFGTFETTPPFAQGVESRMTFQVGAGATPGLYGFSFVPGTIAVTDFFAAAYPNVTVLDYNSTPKYGILALGVPCPQPGDADGDTIPDEVDVCPADPEDFDGVHDADGCSEVDGDGDGALDGVDNCPEVHNEDQADFDGDTIGDPCDYVDDDNDNDGFTNADEIAAGSNPGDPNSTPEVCDGWDNDLNGQADEGYPDTDGDGAADCVDNCPATANPDQADNDGDGIPGQQPLPGQNFGGDVCDPDDDNDGFRDEHEAQVLGTDPTQACPADPSRDAWPPDINRDRSVNILDVLLYKPQLGGPYDGRYDLTGDGSVNIIDVLFYKPYKPLLGTRCGAPQAELLFPEGGSVVNGGSLLVATELNGLSPWELKDALLQYSPDGVTYTTIDTVPAYQGYVEAVWDTSALDRGYYYLRVVMENLYGDVSTDTIQVLVNEQPIAQAALVEIIEPGNYALFDASGSYDTDGSIVEYIWDFGDGSPPYSKTTSLVSHPYAEHGIFGVSLTVVDDLGGEATAHYILDKPNILFDEKTDCGCEAMTISDSNGVEGPPGFDLSPENATGIPAGEQKNLGPYNDGVAGELPVQLQGEGPFRVKMRFEVIALLKERSKPQLCKEGQRVQATYTFGLGGQPQVQRWTRKKSTDPTEPPGEKVTCGYRDPDWCWEPGYTGATDDLEPPNKLKTYEGEEWIFWLDLPGFDELWRENLAPNGTTFQARFHAKVKGPSGTCECTWEVVTVVDKTAKVTKNQVRWDTVDCR